MTERRFVPKGQIGVFMCALRRTSLKDEKYPGKQKASFENLEFQLLVTELYNRQSHKNLYYIMHLLGSYIAINKWLLLSIQPCKE